MTREEAMKELSYILDEMPSMECADWIEALSMGIKALQQESCDDCVSREAVLKCFTLDNTKADVWNNIKALPSAKSAEKVGYWIIYDVHGHKACKCSECGMDVGYPCNDKFCKHCGVKMQEVTKND